MCGSVWRVCTGVVWRVYVCRCSLQQYSYNMEGVGFSYNDVMVYK